jgi:malate dehydrogenase (oxaloacetate-decarboxylating)
VALQAVRDGVARRPLTYEEAFEKAERRIREARELFHRMMDEGFIEPPPVEMIRAALERAVASVSGDAAA